MLNHHRPPPTNPSAEIPGFVDLSLLIDTKWSVSLLMNLWNQVVTIYFIPNNFFQTVLPCLSLCLTWVLIKGPVMCLKCRHPRPADRTPSKGRQVGSLSSSLALLIGLCWLQIGWFGRRLCAKDGQSSKWAENWQDEVFKIIFLIGKKD